MGFGSSIHASVVINIDVSSQRISTLLEIQRATLTHIDSNVEQHHRRISALSRHIVLIFSPLIFSPSHLASMDFGLVWSYGFLFLGYDVTGITAWGWIRNTTLDLS